jgi:hypothetical protein
MLRHCPKGQSGESPWSRDRRAAQVTMNELAYRRRGALFAGALVVVVGMFAGCAGGITKSSPDDVKRAAATERSQGRWALIINKEPARAYEYLSKASRQVISRQDFVDRVSRTAFRSADVEKVECVEDLCKVIVRYTYDHPMMKGVGNTLQETWILEDGVYVYVWPS